nr:hypothetical protein [uncultured Pseudomonas sp.]
MRELAAKMTITEVQRELKISKTMLRTIATEHDITFIKRRLEVEPKELARIKRMARLMTRRKAAKNLGTSEARLGRIAEHYGFEFQAYPGSPKGQRDIPPERLQMYRERLIALRDIGITRTQAARSRKSRKKAKETAERLGIVKREWPVPIGIDAMLKALCTQHDFKDWRELIETAIQRLHESPDQAAAFLGVTRHNFQITEKVARHFHNESLRELRRNPGDENNAPTH